MKKLPKLSILTLLIFLCLPSFSQAKFGLKGSINLTNVAQNFSESDYEWATLPRILFSVGGVVDIGLNDMISLQPGLGVSLKGFGIDTDEEFDESGYVRQTVAFIDIPVNIAFKFGKFQAYAGPYIGIAVWGKQKWDVGGDTGDEEIKFVMKDATYDEWYDSEDFGVMKRIDYGLSLGAGYQLGPVLLGIGGEIGLANLNPDVQDLEDYDPADYKVFSRCLSVSATFFLGQ